MVRNFPVEVVPLKLIKVSSQDITAFGGLLKTGWTMESTYEVLPHRYMVDSTEVLHPVYMGEYKKKWVAGWVHSRILLSKYPEDPFIQQCSRIDLRKDPHDHIACMLEIEDEKAINVRVITPVKVRIHGLLHKRGQLHQA